MLGSVPRQELIQMIERQISHEKRLQVPIDNVKICKEEVQANAFRENLDKQNKNRQPSFFEIMKVIDVVKIRELANNEMLPPNEWKATETITHAKEQSLGTGLPTLTLNNEDSITSNSTGYTTISCTSLDSRNKTSLDASTQNSFSTMIAQIDCSEESIKLLSNSNSIRIVPASGKVQLVIIIITITTTLYNNQFSLPTNVQQLKNKPDSPHFPLSRVLYNK